MINKIRQVSSFVCYLLLPQIDAVFIMNYGLKGYQSYELKSYFIFLSRYNYINA